MVEIVEPRAAVEGRIVPHKPMVGKHCKRSLPGIVFTHPASGARLIERATASRGPTDGLASEAGKESLRGLLIVGALDELRHCHCGDKQPTRAKRRQRAAGRTVDVGRRLFGEVDQETGIEKRGFHAARRRAFFCA